MPEACEFIKYEQATNQSDSENIRLINKDGNTQNLAVVIAKMQAEISYLKGQISKIKSQTYNSTATSENK